MDKIILIYQPFDSQSTLHVFEDGELVRTQKVSSNLSSIANDLVNCAYSYNIYNIDLANAKVYELSDLIQEIENNKYSQSKIIVKEI